MRRLHRRRDGEGLRDDPSAARDDARRRHDRLPARARRGDRLPPPGRRPELQLDLGRRRAARRTTAVCLLANGASGIERTPATDAAFALALGRGLRRARRSRSSPTARARRCSRRSRSPAPSTARRRGRSPRRIATSPLVKTALFGHDANWGRVLAAAGSAPYNGGFAAVDADPRDAVATTATIVLEQRRAAPTSSPTSRTAACRIELDLGLGGGARELPDERPLLRLRPHQRGLPDMSLRRRQGGRRRRGGARRRSCSGSPQRARGLRRPRRRPADLGRDGARGPRGRFVERTARDDAPRRSRSCGTRSPPSTRRSARRSARARCRSSATRSASHAMQVPELGLVGDAAPVAARRRSRRRSTPGLIPVVAPLGGGPAERQRRRGGRRARRRPRRRAAPLPHRRSGPAPRRCGRRRRSASARPSGCSTPARSRAGSSRSCAPRSAPRGSGVDATIGATAVLA